MKQIIILLLISIGLCACVIIEPPSFTTYHNFEIQNNSSQNVIAKMFFKMTSLENDNGYLPKGYTIEYIINKKDSIDSNSISFTMTSYGVSIDPATISHFLDSMYIMDTNKNLLYKQAPISDSLWIYTKSNDRQFSNLFIISDETLNIQGMTY